MRIERFAQNPIIRPHMDDRMGANINGPSLIRAPDWLPGRLGEYYLYFAHHSGDYIRLAYAEQLEGPWTVHTPGALQMAETPFTKHIASPDVHVDDDRRRIILYYHGCGGTPDGFPSQMESVAVSTDGVHFRANDNLLGPSYWRVFRWREHHYALAMPGVFYRSADPLTGFEEGPTLFSEHMRHSAVMVERDVLSVFYSQAGDCPERILLATIDLRPDWTRWRATEPVTVLEPETDYEGARLPLLPSRRGAARGPVRHPRNPCLSREEDRTFLLYAVAGESGVALAELHN